MLVTALEANEDVPKLETVTERILHQERKTLEKCETHSEKAMTHRTPRKKIRCHYCGKIGHIKRFCRDFKAEKEKRNEKTEKASIAVTDAISCSEDSVEILFASHALSATSSKEQCAWIVDSGATCHMCRDKKSFATLKQLEEPIDIALGDGHTLTAIGRGEVVLDMVLPNGESKPCKLHDVLYVPKLSYNLLSVTKASQKDKVVKFTKSACYVLNQKHKMVAKATKVGSLYQLNHKVKVERANFAQSSVTNEDVWHKRFGHLSASSLQKLISTRKACHWFQFRHYKAT